MAKFKNNENINVGKDTKKPNDSYFAVKYATVHLPCKTLWQFLKRKKEKSMQLYDPAITMVVYFKETKIYTNFMSVCNSFIRNSHK